MKEIFLVVVGLAAGALGVYTFFCQEAPPSRVVDASVIEDKLKETGDVVFGEKPMSSNADLRIEKAVIWFGKKVASDGAVIKAKWRGLHRYGINLKDNPLSFQQQDGKLVITIPPYEKRVSYIEGGKIDFDTINGSWFIKKDKRYEVAMRLLYEQNASNGEAYMKTDDGKAELLKACQSSVSGIIYPLIKNKQAFEVVCQHPA
jgi:hypothetical protein